ncbi:MULTISPECIES: recombination regulator RecX [Betaproteobacteria]|jgi:regulatory protein|uniref:recombination regulator RecX n=1 Tax=Betaproteobacteria TaxID=28216 RepID=UPI00258335D2|nr:MULTISPECIES: recombination regulator RecX [Betaproteobacteria]MDT3705442.1 recombination regulator RecX [Thiobacillus sp.]
MKTKSTPEPGELRERALRLLARREHSRFELARKLAAAGFPQADVGALLDEFERKNWLSDRRFAESWVADHRAKAGSVKLAFELRQRGVAEAVIEAVLGDNRDSELERAREVWQKKFGAAPDDAAEKARQMRFLQSRGFTSDVIRRVMANGARRSPEFGE